MATPRPCTEARVYGFQRGETESLVSDMPAFCLLPLPPAPIAGEQRTREGRALSPAAVSVCLALETQSLFSPPSRSGVACKARTDQDWLDSFGFSDVLFCVVAAPTIELRPVPAGVDDFVHRGPANLARLLSASKFLAVVKNYPFAADPPDAATKSTSNMSKQTPSSSH